MIVKGQLPGVSKQSGLFRDGLGHPKTPLSDGASYRKSFKLSNRLWLIYGYQSGLPLCTESIR